jgi:hypothetical protein
VLTMSCSAELRLDRALERRYRWPSDFAGFDATARLGIGGESGSTREAEIRVPGSGPARPHQGEAPDLVAAVEELIDGLRRPWVLHACLPWPKQSAWSTASRGELLRVADPARTTLRLHGDQLVEVRRDVGDRRVAWRIDRWHPAPAGGVLPSSVLVSVADRRTGRAQWFDRVNDEYQELDGVLVPTRRRTVRWIDHRRVTSDLQLLDQVSRLRPSQSWVSATPGSAKK